MYLSSDGFLLYYNVLSTDIAPIYFRIRNVHELSNFLAFSRKLVLKHFERFNSRKCFLAKYFEIIHSRKFMTSKQKRKEGHGNKI